MRRFVLFATLLLAVGVAFFFWFRDERPDERAAASPGAATPKRAGSEGGGQTSPTAFGGRSIAAARTSQEADFPIATPLNAPDSTITRDLEIVQHLFEAWQSNFPREGNPVGENAEITAALLGDNRLGLALIPKDHRALNSHGELCDRWGTPFRFHQLSGTKMEVRSAGPDRKFATEDDAVRTPQ